VIPVQEAIGDNAKAHADERDTKRSRKARRWSDGTRLYAATTALAALTLGLVAPHSPGAGVISAASSGALYVLHRPRLSLVTAVLLAIGALPAGEAAGSPIFWADLVLVSCAALLPRRLTTTLLRVPRWSWPAAMTVGALCLFAYFFAGPILGPTLGILSALCAAFIGAGIARHLAMVDARLLAWGEGGMAEVTRDLLLGRIASGMLHDLAQPLNVISMANANMDYIVSHLDIDEVNRQQIHERVARIATHTEGAAHILSLFRWFGRDGREGDGALTVQNALECAIATTRSNVRHHGVAVHLRGTGLDYLVPGQYGALQMMAVAALLSAFSSFFGKDGSKHKGEVLLNASITPAHVVITVDCMDENANPMPARTIDGATLWLVEQVAQEASSEFRCVLHNRKPLRFVIRLGRDDI
jgi:signal transduction histidine kinase